jgi:hypothetical protein
MRGEDLSHAVDGLKQGLPFLCTVGWKLQTHIDSPRVVPMVLYLCGASDDGLN